MDWKALAMLIGAVGVLSGIILGWLGRSRSVKQDIQADAGQDGFLRANVDYIRHSVDEMRLEVREHGRRFDGLAERVTRIEESTKSAHHRLERLEKDKS